MRERLNLENVSKLRREGMKRLKPYINLIEDYEIKEFTQKSLIISPPYFWKIPASKGKYHPTWAREEGGLVKHTVLAMYLGNELCRTFNIIKTDKDIILSALALHDTMKRGLKETDHKTYHLYHPYYPRLHYKKYRIKGFEVEYDKIMDCIESHMGSLNPDDHWGIISKAKPTNMPEAIVHLADYIASRDKIYFKDFM